VRRPVEPVRNSAVGVCLPGGRPAASVRGVLIAVALVAILIWLGAALLA
jgi:hypothetical protein